MSKKIAFALLLLIGVGIGIALVKSEQTQTTVIAEPTLVMENTVLPTEVPTLVENIPDEEIAQSAEEMLQRLNDKSAENLKSGWVHIHTEIISDNDTGNHGVFPNGVAIPLHQISDLWALVNENKLVTESVSIMRAVDGEIIQVGTYKNGIGNNSVIDDPVSQEPFPLVFDRNFSGDLKRMQENGDTATLREFVDEEGGAKIEFYASSTFDVPVQSVDYNQRSVSIETRVLFDKETGIFEQKEVIVHLEDGTARVFQKITNEVTQEDPADEALAFLNALDE